MQKSHRFEKLMKCCLALTALQIMPLLGRAQQPSKDSAAVENSSYEELNRFYDGLIADADRQRQQSWHRDYSSIEAYEKGVAPHRDKLWQILGGRLERLAPLHASETLIGEFDSHNAYRVAIDLLEEVHVHGILLVPRSGKKHAALICVHGMGGTPEDVCGLTEKPDYHNRFGLQAVNRGYVVFAPENVNKQKDRSWLDRKAILVGQRLQALEQAKAMRVVDYLASREDVHPKRIGAYGISWGGRTVMNLAALDPRVAAVAISGHFNELLPKMITPSPEKRYTAFIETAEDYAFFSDHLRHFSDADVVSLICPRPVLIEQGREDKVVDWKMSEKAFAEVQEIYKRLGIQDRAVYQIYEGGHVVYGGETFDFLDHWLKP
jgi:dienelactone hydrolase